MSELLQKQFPHSNERITPKANPLIATSELPQSKFARRIEQITTPRSKLISPTDELEVRIDLRP
jgi:hypothetical protein